MTLSWQWPEIVSSQSNHKPGLGWSCSNITVLPGRTPHYLICLLQDTWPCHKAEAMHRSHLPWHLTVESLINLLLRVKSTLLTWYLVLSLLLLGIISAFLPKQQVYFLLICLGTYNSSIK